MNLIPFGEVKEDRVKISKDYKLIEMAGGIWRLSAKAKRYYDPDSYIHYLRGDIEKPVRIAEPVKPKPAKKMTVQEELRSPEVQELLNDIFKL